MKSDSRVLIFCLVVLLCIGGAFILVDSSKVDVEASNTIEKDSLIPETAPSHTEPSYHKVSELRPFDPNTAQAEELLSLGLPPYTVKAICKYREKGGCYTCPEDFARMHGVTLGLYKRLLPYIHISNDYRPAAEFVEPRRKTTYPTVRDTLYPRKMHEGDVLAINTADTTSLKTIPGIGSYLARKIVDYRQRLGGFISRDQLLEIDHFPESALSFITVPDDAVRQININRADFRHLSSHPYIGYSRTKAIMQYRKVKGRIQSLSQLSLLPGFSEQERERMKPYISF